LSLSAARVYLAPAHGSCHARAGHPRRAQALPSPGRGLRSALLRAYDRLAVLRDLFGGPLVVATVACSVVAGASGPGPIDLHTVDWNQVVLPGSVCGADHPIKLHSGYATVRSRRWPALARVYVDRGRVVYGDLNGHGRDDAALQIVCANLGGTAAGQLAFAVVVYSPGIRTPTAVGVLTPLLRSTGHHVPILMPVSVTHDRVTVTEFTYGPHDPDCCPSGQATTVWLFKAGRFRPGSTHVQRQPNK
jgi:hypothetical protein